MGRKQRGTGVKTKTKVKLLAIAEASPDDTRPGHISATGIHWIRRIAKFPQVANLVLIMVVDLAGDSARGKQEIRLKIHVPGQEKPDEQTLPQDFGQPSDPRSILLIRWPLTLTFGTAGVWRFSVWHKSMEWGRMDYRVVTEEAAQAAAKRLAKEGLLYVPKGT